MAQFKCCTCAVSGSDDVVSKHLSSTRHKSIIYEELEETVECEECEDTNVHQLQLLRYGLSDMALLCQLCLQKEEKASTQYTLSNGSLLKKLPQYFTLRDLECEKCQSTDDLYVGNSKSVSKKSVLCGKCLAESTSAALDFTSENDPKFLFALFGIKEFVPSSKGRKKGLRQRRKGKPSAKRERKPRSKTPNDQEAEKRREHYFNTKAVSLALKSGTTVPAVGSASQPASNKKGTQNLQGKSSQKDRTNGAFSKKASENHKHDKKSVTKSTQKPSVPGRPAKSNKSTPPPSGFGLTGKQDKNKSRTGQTTPVNGGNPSRAQGGKVELKSTNGTGGRKTDQSKASNSSSSKPQANGKKKAETKNINTHRELSKPEARNGQKKTTLDSNKPKKQEPKKQEPKKQESKKQESKSRDVVSKEKEEKLAIPLTISKYEPSKDPKLSYDSMTSYFQEISYNLFLEERINAQTSGSNIWLLSNDFNIEWYVDQDKKQKQFKLLILLTDALLNRFISKKMQSLKKVPFSIYQTLFLVLGDDIAWYGQIATVDTKRAIKSKKNSDKVLEAVVELYPWNTQQLPRTVDVKWLKILPASVPVSRVFMAMTRISNTKFQSMLLGKDPIKQIVFRNYVKYSRDSLNQSQKVAVQSVLNNSITVLQGPPGSGKTSTIFEIILQLLDNLNTFPILVVAASNIAIDNIAEKLMGNHALSILRIVANDKEKEYNRDHYLGSICLHHKVYDSLSMYMKEIMDNLKNGRSHLVSQNQYKKLLAEQIRLSDMFIAQAKVIFTTTVVAGGNQLKSVKKLPVVIMDEATQSSEPTTLIPLSMPGVDKFVFVGDQKQLSSFSQVPNLSLSLFERVLLNGTYKSPHMLDTQYRMHPLISEFPRKRFYGGLLKDGITADDRKMDGLPENPVYFWDTVGKCRESRIKVGFREDRGYTYVNRPEVDLIKQVVINLIYEHNVKRSDIGVITPYRGQRDLISSELVKDTLINPENKELYVEVDRDDIDNDTKPVTIHMVSDIMIASIDAFQGREKNFMVMSCVRSNAENKVGFLSDERRLNVALTRAKYGLVLVGDKTCLKSSPVWDEYISHLDSVGSIHADTKFAY